MIIIRLPFPPSVLRPNDRTHWRGKNPIKRQYRMDCYLLAKQYTVLREWIKYMEVTFYPPNNRWDWDAMVSASKAAFDGLADGIAVNDKLFRPTLKFAPPDKYNPRLEIKFGISHES